MNALDIRIKELVAYARERDGEDRIVLFRNLIDLFLTGKAPNINPTRSQLLDVIEALIPHVEADSRRTTCELVANMSNPPMDLVLRLCRDRASLVVNLLTQVMFDEDDLIELIEKTGREHHQLIASREDLSANIWIALARAAPSAPPFDHQSTLALWSDDLGITQTAPTTKPEPKPQGPAAPQSHAHQSRQSATVTPLHAGRIGSKASGIRILQTDKDLIAARTQAIEPAAHSQSYAIGQNTADQAHALDALVYQEDFPTEEISADTSETQSAGPPKPDEDKPSTVSAEGDAHAQPYAHKVFEEKSSVHTSAQDPGPGGWAWLSDRDGFITSVSPQGQSIHGNNMGLIGSSMLDLLGLNTKLGHPVARAFQRRSAIHDAPIFLPSLNTGFQHWTLEATPFFSAGGGIFEGYEGILTPVVPANHEDSPVQNDEGASALFLDEMDDGSSRMSPAAFTDTATVFSAADKQHINAAFSDPDTPERKHKKGATPQALEDIAHALRMPANTAPDTQSRDDKPAPSADTTMLTEAATSVVKDVLAEALFSQNTGDQSTSPNSTKPTELEEQQPGPDLAHAPTINAQLEATLDVLDEALLRLIDAGKNSGDAQVRLQGEIASACARTLRDQLK